MAGSIPADPSRMLDQEASTMGGGFLNTNFMASTAKVRFQMQNVTFRGMRALTSRLPLKVATWRTESAGVRRCVWRCAFGACDRGFST